jgi:hypothetical protein
MGMGFGRLTVIFVDQKKSIPTLALPLKGRGYYGTNYFAVMRDLLNQIRIGMTTYLKSPFSGIVISADELESPSATLT